jgi:hypothetical protein
MMVLSGGEVIDATRMGGLARFINHSCEPNCGVEKWEVNGEERCAIFALRDINSGEELTFDYKFQSFSALVRLTAPSLVTRDPGVRVDETRRHERRG